MAAAVTDPGVELVAEQIRHAMDLVKGQQDALKAELDHYKQLTNLRLTNLESKDNDMEMRLRTATEGVTQFKLFSGLSSGGSFIMAFVAIIKTFLGTP